MRYRPGTRFRVVTEYTVYAGPHRTKITVRSFAFAAKIVHNFNEFVHEREMKTLGPHWHTCENPECSRLFKSRYTVASGRTRWCRECSPRMRWREYDGRRRRH
jgi:hypothetical protein